MNPRNLKLQTPEEPSLLDFLLSTPVLIALVLLSTIGSSFYLPLFDLDEGAFSEATREMLASGNWISTYLNGEPRHDKPILIYWLQAASVLLFGEHPFAFRIPSILSAIAWIWVVYRFSAEFFDDYSARLAVWVLSCSWLASVIFMAAIADALLNLLLCLVFFDIYRYTQKPDKGLLLRISVAIGLGFLTKGPVAVVLPLASSLIALLLCGKFRVWLQAVFHPISILVFLAVIAPWHIAVYWDQGLAFFEGFYLGHNLGRFNNTMESHGGQALYYILFLPVLLLPFSAQLLYLLRTILSTIKQRQDTLSVYLIVWFLLTLSIFSFSKTQLPHYLLYGMTPLFILIGNKLALKAKQGERFIADRIVAVSSVLLFCLLPLALEFTDISSQSYQAASAKLALSLFYERYWWISLLFIIVAIVLGVVQALTTPLSRQLLLAATLVSCVNFVTLPWVAGFQQQPIVAAAAFIKEHYNDHTIIAHKIKMPSISVELSRIVPNANPEAGDIVVSRIGKIESDQQLNERFHIDKLFSQGGIGLYAVTSR